MLRRPLLLACLLAASLLMASCASYSRMTDRARAELAQGRVTDALAVFPEKKASGKDEVLIRMERGILLQLLGRYEESTSELEAAAAKMRHYEERAVISASKTASQVGSLLLNEQAIPYEGEDFEKILVHAYDALNYLMMGDLEGARVEIRNAYQRQTELYDKHEKALEKARKEDQGPGWETSFQKADKARYESIRKKAGDVRSVYQNAFAYYLSSLVYELGGEEDEAYIDLKKGIEAAPWSKDMQKDLIRLSRKLNVPADTEKLQAAYGTQDKDYGKGVDVFIVFQQGTAPVKEELNLPIPVHNGGLVFASMPVYVFPPAASRSGEVSYGTASYGTTTLCDIDAIAAKNLLDQYPIIFAKQVARTYLKARMTSRLSKDFGAVGAIGGTLAAVVTERADLRAWSMLPREIQAARVFVPEKTRRLRLTTGTPGGAKDIDIPEKTRHLVVLCRVTGTGLTLQTKAF